MTLFAHPLRPPHSPSASLDRQDSEALVEIVGAYTLLKGESGHAAAVSAASAVPQLLTPGRAQRQQQR
jgi:hypothetical protein